MVLQWGFPGINSHSPTMGMLKWHTMRRWFKKHANKQGVFISGVRKFESNRRNKNFPLPISKDSGILFACPFFYKTSEWVYRYLHENGLRITPVHDKLGFSGECMCGCYAGRGEKDIMIELDPQLADYIAWLEEGVKKFGTDAAKKYPTWGGKTQSSMQEMQMRTLLDQFIPDAVSDTVCGAECGPGTLRGDTDFDTS